MCWALRNGKPPDPWSTATSTGTVGTVYDAGAGPGGASGRLVTVTDQAGVARTNVQDALGRLVGVSEGCTGCITTYTYDVLDNLRTVTQGAQQRTFAFDSLKRLSGATNPEDGATNYSSYDSQGNLLAKTHVGDVTTNYAYDAQNRVTSKSYTSRTYTDGAVATPSAVYCYDGNVVNTSITCSAASPAIPYSIGRLTGSGNSVSVTKYASYDALGRVTASQQTPNGQSAYQFSYTYNPAGGLTSITYPSNRTVSYLYDAAGRASAAKNGAANSTDNYATIGSYWPHGAVNQMTLGNTQTETSVYNDRLQPASLTVSGNLLALNYYYCTNLVLSCTTNNGNLMSEVIGAGKYGLNLTQNFTYDGVNRLLTGTETGTGGWSQTQGYDQWGNRWLASYNGLPPPSTSVPDATAFPGTNGNNNRMSLSGVAYDTAANLQLFNTADLRYDAENRLVKATKNSTVYTYGYDCEGRRVARTSPNGTTTYVYDAQGQLAAEYGPAVENPDSGRRYLTADHLGSTRLVTDANGNDVVRYDYLPFGEEITVGTHGRTSVMGYGAATGGKLEFTGKERDAETGLDYFGARYMSSTQARFTSIDPKVFSRRTIEHPQKWNKYAYVQNNPLTSIDPNGLDDYRVFITAPEAGGGNWAAAKKSAEANGHTMQIFRGSEASIQNYNKAISDTSARVVLAGHSTFDPATHITNGVPLGNGTSYGTTSTHSDMDLRTDPPTLSPTFFQTTNVSANSVALFACDSIAIAGQYSGAGLFVGMDSGADHLSSLSAMGAAAAAWVMADAQSRPDSTGQSTFVGPVSPIANANTAFNQNAGGQPGVYTDQGDKVVEVKKDPKP